MKKVKLVREHKISRDALSKAAKYTLHTLQERPGSSLTIRLLGDNKYYWLNDHMSDAQYPIPGTAVRELELAGWIIATPSQVWLKS